MIQRRRRTSPLLDSRPLFMLTAGLVAFAAFGALMATRVAAQEKRYAIDAYDVALAVQPDGSYRVTERLAYRFEGGTFTFAYRDVPMRFIGGLTLDSVTLNGRRLEDVRVRAERGQEHIRWAFPPTSGHAEFGLAYTVRGALFAHGVNDIVDWDAVGNEWTVPISNVRVAVLLPAALVRDSAGLTAPLGRISRTDDGWRVDYEYPQLPPRTAYRAIVSFPKVLAGRGDWPGTGTRVAGAAPRRSAGSSLPADYRWKLPLAIVLGFLPGIWLLVLWRGPRREETGAGQPPAPLQRAAAILPELSGGPARVFGATLLDLAARGHLELRRTGSGRVFKQTKVEAIRRDVPADPLSPFEREYLDELARYPTLDRFAMKGGRYRRRVLADMRRALIAEGLLEDHSRRSYTLIALAIVLELGGAALVIATAMGGGPGFVRLLPWAVALVGLAPGLLIAAIRLRTPTESGALLRAQVLGYLASLRSEMERALEGSPVEAARLYIANLPWLTLDTKVSAYWVQKLAAKLKKADGDLPTPGWAVDTTGGRAKGSDAYVAFMPYYHVTAAAAGAAGAGAGGAGAGGAGAGAGGGAGGGGGGAG